MIDINLLPPEIHERRKAEKRVLYLLAGIGFLLLLLMGVSGINGFRIRRERKSLAKLKLENQGLNEAIKEYEIYEKRKAQAQEREKIVAQALAGEVAWHKILNEISMVIPSDVWLVEFKGDDIEGITCKGYTLDYSFDQPDLGHKPVAKWIVRLGEIKKLRSIWLDYSQKTTYEEQPAIEFEITAELAGAQTVPAPHAPPKSSGK